MAKPKEQAQAIKLREKGNSISSIATQLHVSKSTVSHWCKDISLTKEQIRAIAIASEHRATEALLRSAENQRKERRARVAAETQKGAQLVGSLSDRDVIMVGLGLYWGEGYKKGSQELGFTNSDPKMILFYLRWLRVTFNITSEQLIFRVSINNLHKAREKEVLQYWAQLLHVPLSQFTKTSLIQTAAKKYSNHTKHFGTLRVKVRSGTALRHRILGAIQALN